jgi:hypothetical protein
MHSTSASLHLAVLIAGKLPQTLAGWLFWLGLLVVLGLLLRGSGSLWETKTSGVDALVVIGVGLAVFVLWVVTSGRIPPP